MASTSISSLRGMSRDSRGALDANQFRPHFVPALGAQVPAAQTESRALLQANCGLGFHLSAPSQQLVEVERIDPQFLGESATLLGCECSHARQHSTVPCTKATCYATGRANCYRIASDMKPIGEIRQLRLKQFLEQTGLSFAEINTRLGRNRRDATLNQVAQAAKNTSTGKPRRMGDAQARLLESTFHLPEGWFDSDPSTKADLIAFKPDGTVYLIDVDHMVRPAVVAEETKREYQVKHGWPFATVTRDEVLALDPDQKAKLELLMKAFIGSPDPQPDWKRAARKVAAVLDHGRDGENFTLFVSAVEEELRRQSAAASTQGSVRANG